MKVRELQAALGKLSPEDVDLPVMLSLDVAVVIDWYVEAVQVRVADVLPLQDGAGAAGFFIESTPRPDAVRALVIK